VETVFQAVVKRESFTKVFFPESSGDLVQGATITWAMDASRCNVYVDEVVENERIEITFRPSDFAIAELQQGDKRNYEAKLVFLFEPADVGGTLVTLCEYGWQSDRRSILQSYGHCSGWQEMLMCLKAYLMHGIDLKSPPSVRPDYSKLWSSQ
jgi:uncharacterized protein YndB with AHSA1/START domain